MYYIIYTRIQYKYYMKCVLYIVCITLFIRRAIPCLLCLGETVLIPVELSRTFQIELSVLLYIISTVLLEILLAQKRGNNEMFSENDPNTPIKLSTYY
jgi:hypothetical protein